LLEDAREALINQMIAFAPSMNREQAERMAAAVEAIGGGMSAANQRADHEKLCADKAEEQLASALGKLETELQLARAEIAALKKLEKACSGTAVQKTRAAFDKRIGPDGEFMTIKQFGERLDSYGLITKQPGAKEEGQHVFHIIANSNGGPDHTHNYLYALGGTFNISIGDRLDHLNCILAGKEAARRAVAISLKEAKDSTLQNRVALRNGKRTLYTEGPHNAITNGETLFDKGQSLFARAIRATARDDAKQAAA
jgi:23S rRNA pseudoU1915 N3-methylase RlmH